MVDTHRWRPMVSSTLLAVFLGGCGQTGDLYLPQSEGEIVTRPTQTPSPEAGESPSSPQSVDSPALPTPAPEVTEPEDEKPKQQPPPSTPPSPRP